MTSSCHSPAEEVRSASPAGDDPDALFLDAARDSILAVGWRRTTLTEVARRSQVSRMTIYRRWPDMRTLLGDLLVREWSQVLTAALPGVGAQPDTGAIARGIASIAIALRDNPLFSRIVEVDPELLLPYLLQRRGRNQDRVLQVLEQVLRAGQSTGAVRRGDVRLMARSTLLAAQGFVLSAHTMTDGRVRASHLDRELTHLIEGHLLP